LGEQGVPVRVIVRDAKKAAALATDGVDVLKGDLEVPASIDAAMQGVLSVVLVTQPVVQQELNVIASAVRAGVEHVVKITTKASADSPIARRRKHAEIENALIASGLGYTLLRNNAYMQNFLMMAPGPVASNEVLRHPGIEFTTPDKPSAANRSRRETGPSVQRPRGSARPARHWPAY